MASLVRTWSLSRATSEVIKRNFRTNCRILYRPASVLVARKDIVNASVLRPISCSWQKSVRQYGSHYENWKTLKYEDFIALLDGGDIQLIDVRDSKDVGEQGQFPNAINIPLCDLKESLGLSSEEFKAKFGVKQPELEDTNIVFASFTAVKSSAALEIAHKKGYKNARAYENGFEEWKVRQEEKNHRGAGTSSGSTSV